MSNPGKQSVSCTDGIGIRMDSGAGVDTQARAVRSHSAAKGGRVVMTQKWLEALKCPEGRVNYSDIPTPGLTVRVSANKKSWSFWFTVPGGRARAQLHLGTFPATPLKLARELALKARGLVEAEIDPRTVEAPKAIKTVAQVIDDRIARDLRHSSKRYVRTCLKIEARYDKDVIPAKYGNITIGQVPITDFGPQHLRAIIEPIENRGAFTQAIHVFQDVRALLKFAKREGEIGNNLISEAKAPKPPVDEDGEDAEGRVLSLDEIRIVWRLLPSAIEQSPNVADIALLELCLGQRLSEIAGMRKPEFTLNTNRPYWTIPADRVKNKKGRHVVPLNGLALDIIRRRIAEAETDVLFPNKKGNPITADRVCKALARPQYPCPGFPFGKLGIPPFTTHDLRRTVSDLPTQSANNLPTADRYMDYVLNHRGTTKNTVRKRNYNPYNFFDEKADALDEWGAFLAKLVGVETGLRVAA